MRNKKTRVLVEVAAQLEQDIRQDMINKNQRHYKALHHDFQRFNQ